MDLTVLSLISLIILSIYFLIRSADLIEDSFVYLSKKLGISEFFVGFIILATVSSLPELAIAINSSREVPELSVGNLLGATLIMLTLILGLSAIKFESVNFKGRFRRREMFAGIFLIIFSLFTLIDKKLTVTEGFVLIGLYFLLFLDLQRQFSKDKEIVEDNMVPARKVYILFLKSLAGIIMLLIASYIAVEAVIQLGTEININESLVGLFILAVGTNTPELTLLIRAKNFEQSKLAIGNFIGSGVFNTLTLGILGVLSGGFELSDANFLSLIPVMTIIVFASILFLFFSYTDKELSKNEGYMLMGAYVSLVITELFVITGVI